MLWENPPNDVARPLRKERYNNLRAELRRLVPELTADPLPASQIHGEKVVSLDVSVVASDVHFTELLRCADGLVGAAAIDALEAAGSLYRGRLAGPTGCPHLPLAVRRRPSGALTLRSDFRRLHRDAPSAARGVARQTAPRRAWRELRSCTRRCAPRTPRRSDCGSRSSASTRAPGAPTGWRVRCDTIQRDDRAWAYPGRRDRSRAVATESGACGSGGSTPPRRHSVGRCACPARAEARAPHSLGAARSVLMLGV